MSAPKETESAAAVWSSLDPRAHQWVRYPALLSAVLEQAYRANPQGSCPVEVKGMAFTVAFREMRQVNAKGYHRQVRRVVLSGPKVGECIICTEDLFEAPPLPTAGCTHPSGTLVCERCLAKHISEDLNGKGNLDVRCPVPGCNKALSPSEILAHASWADSQRHDNLLLNRFLQAQAEFRWCSAACGAGQLHVGGAEAPIMTCTKCRAKTCFTHSVPWHPGVTCEEYDGQLRDSDKANEEFLMRETKPCPKCKVPIQKNDGCDHMTCKPPGGCGHEFCWRCLAPFAPIRRDGNHRHRPTCIHYAAFDGAEDLEEDEE